jgi:Ca-activated chloride channel family protein
MMRFLHPEYLWLLMLLPLLFWLHGRTGLAPALLFSQTTSAAALTTGRRRGVGTRSSLLRIAAFCLLILALARPQFGKSTTEIQASGIDIILAVDVSGSMEAMDFTLKGQAANRLEVVKSVVDRFIEARPNDRIGLVAFSGRPYLVSPLTLDHDWLRKRLESLRIGMMEDGTAVGSAIGAATNRLRDQQAKSRLLILLTDGINNAGSISPLIAAEAAETLHIKIYTIGAGTRGEAPVPVQDAFGRRRLVQAKVDIDEETLAKIAEMTGARYFRATDTGSLEKIYSEINAMETTTHILKKFENPRELFSFCIAAALLVLAGEVLLARRRLP